MNGLILVDKPKGITSSQVSIWLKNLLNEKTGHCGTLDPNVSGVLPVLVGKSLKVQEYIQEHDKEYVCLMQTAKKLSKKEITSVFKTFTGRIYQKPPKISAVAKKTRVRNIYKLNLIESKEDLILFKVYCEHGTYIRKLVSDIGILLNQETKMLELRRTSLNGFKEKECYNMFEIKDKIETKNVKKILKSIEFAVQSLPRVEIDSTEDLKHGKKIKAEALKNWKGHITNKTAVAVFHNKQLVAVCKSLTNEPQKRSIGFLLQPDKVLI
jgi:predicted rRNA pseudouridine synthase